MAPYFETEAGIEAGEPSDYGFAMRSSPQHLWRKSSP